MMLTMQTEQVSEILPMNANYYANKNQGVNSLHTNKVVGNAGLKLDRLVDARMVDLRQALKLVVKVFFIMSLFDYNV